MRMTPLLTGVLAGLLVAGTARAEFTMPDTDALKALISNPEQIGTMITTASEDQAALLIIQVISLMQADKADPAAIQQAVGIMFQKTAEIRGAQFGSAVVTLVRKKVNPRLLPIIRMGGAPPPPPPPGPSPRYPNQ